MIPDGTFEIREIFGPDSFERYCKCNDVYPAILLMLEVCDISTNLEVNDQIVKLVNDFKNTSGGDKWPLIYQAFVASKLEWMDRL